MFAALPDPLEPDLMRVRQIMPDQGDTLVLHLKVGGAVIGAVECSFADKQRGTERWRVARDRIAAWHEAKAWSLEAAAIAQGGASPDQRRDIEAAASIDLGPVYTWSDPCLADWTGAVKVPAGAALFRYRPITLGTVLTPRKDALWVGITPMTDGVRLDWFGVDEGVSGPYGFRFPPMSAFERVSSPPAGIKRQFDRG